MTVIKVTCPTCGDIALTPLDLNLTVRPDGARYEFGCPQCTAVTSRSAAEEVVNLLTAAGVPTVEIPAEFFEQRSHAALTHDEILDFAHAIQDDRFLERQLTRMRIRCEQASRTRQIPPTARKRRWRLGK